MWMIETYATELENIVERPQKKQKIPMIEGIISMFV